MAQANPKALTQLPRLALAKAKVLTAREAIVRRTAIPIDEVRGLVQDLLGVLYRNVPPERHALVARELRWLGATRTSSTPGRPGAGGDASDPAADA